MVDKDFYESHFICEGSDEAYVGNGKIYLKKIYDVKAIKKAIKFDIKNQFPKDFPKFKYFESLRIIRIGSGNWEILIPGDFGFTGNFDDDGFLIE